MRYPLATIVMLTAIAAFGAAQTPAWKTTTVPQQCEQIMQMSEVAQAADTCTTVQNEVTWGEWFSGESRSTQFHFLDFFELVFGDDEKRDYAGGDYAGPKLSL